MIAMGLGFQVPIAILAAVQLGITTPEEAAQEPPLRDPRDRRSWRRFLPTIDPVTLLLEMIPLILLYEGSILLAAALDQAGRPGTELAGRRGAPS